MKYFEVIEPYYALIKAGNEKEAIRVYVENVGYDELDMPIKNEIKEVDQLYAVARFAISPGEVGKVEIADILENFKRDRNEVLLIDGSLI